MEKVSEGRFFMQKEMCSREGLSEQNKEPTDQEQVKKEEERIRENGQLTLDGPGKGKIHLLTIIGEIEGHENLSGSTKTTKYEHILPELAKVEDTDEIQGVLVLINTVGGDVSCGLALAEMLASLSKPTVSLVIGDSHSIGVPLAVATDYSFIVPSGTMLVHPVRMSGMLIGTSKTYDYFEMIQDRILTFVSSHSRVSYEKLKELMHSTKMLSKDLGTVLVGERAVQEGLIDEIGGIQDALRKLYEMIKENQN
ncbi:MAG: Clp protease [Lachnoclostridium sp.]|nr:Clp protease [Lachnoclostridium sp.]